MSERKGNTMFSWERAFIRENDPPTPLRMARYPIAKFESAVWIVLRQFLDESVLERLDASRFQTSVYASQWNTNVSRNLTLCTGTIRICSCVLYHSRLWVFNWRTTRSWLLHKTSSFQFLWWKHVLPARPGERTQLVLLFVRKWASLQRDTNEIYWYNRVGRRLLQWYCVRHLWSHNDQRTLCHHSMTLLDFWLWFYVKDNVYARVCRSNNQLKQAIAVTLNSVPLEMIRNSYREFYRRCRLCVAENGGHIEHLV